MRLPPSSSISTFGRGRGRSDFARRVDLAGLDCHLAGLGLHQLAADADVVVEIEQLHDRERVSQVVTSEVDLDAPDRVFEVAENDLTLRSPGLDPSRDRDLRALLPVLVLVQGERPGRSCVCADSRMRTVGPRAPSAQPVFRDGAVRGWLSSSVTPPGPRTA